MTKGEEVTLMLGILFGLPALAIGGFAALNTWIQRRPLHTLVLCGVPIPHPDDPRWLDEVDPYGTHFKCGRFAISAAGYPDGKMTVDGVEIGQCGPYYEHLRGRWLERQHEALTARASDALVNDDGPLS